MNDKKQNTSYFKKGSKIYISKQGFGEFGSTNYYEGVVVGINDHGYFIRHGERVARVTFFPFNLCVFSSFPILTRD